MGMLFPNRRVEWEAQEPLLVEASMHGGDGRLSTNDFIPAFPGNRPQRIIIGFSDLRGRKTNRVE
jgi:hypothetical protein